MDVKDIRLIATFGAHDQESPKSLVKNTDDAGDKFDVIEIEHAPIGLLDRVRSRQSTARQDTCVSDITDADQD
jgi:hypothetical protein